jgi:hypothetical protein
MSDHTTELAVREQDTELALPMPSGDAGALAQLRGWLEAASIAEKIAAVMCKGPFAPRGFRGNADATATAILAGMELGFSPSRALRSFHVIDATQTATLSAESMRALVRAKGHEIKVIRGNDAATVRARRRGTDEWLEVTFTIEDAIAAELVERMPDGRLKGKDNWRKYPVTMCANRATTQMCKDNFSDVIGGLDGAEEMQDAVDTGSVRVEVVEPAEQPRARAAAVLAAATPAPTAQQPATEPAPAAAAPREPEQPAAEAPVDPDGQVIDQRTWARINARFVELGVSGPGQTAKRLAVVSAIVGRTIERGSELTEAEGGDILGHLSAELVRDVLTPPASAPAPAADPAPADPAAVEPGGDDYDPYADYDPTMDGAEAQAEGQ